MPSEQRVKREHGVRFDALVRSADHQMHGEALDPSDDDASLRRGATGPDDDDEQK